MKKESKMGPVREILSLLVAFDIKGMLLKPTTNGLLQFCRYCFVGGIATIVDWSVLYCTERLGFHYLLAAVFGFVSGLVCNYVMSKKLVFVGNSAKVDARREFIAYAAVGVAGLGLTLVLMYILTEWLKVYFLVSKIVATVLVLIWNFLGRKMLYR